MEMGEQMGVRGLSGSTLKLIAVVTMLIDHIGATVILRLLLSGPQPPELHAAYSIMRDIGRIAFPIYCFLLVEGFMRTRSRWRYAVRLGAFALISEIPFDLAFNSRVLEFGYQNVFFTLTIAFFTIWAMHFVTEKREWHLLLRVALWVPIGFAGMMLAWLMQTDYDAKGVLCVIALYVFRNVRWYQIIAGCLAFGWFEPPALLAFIPIAFYNGSRGWKIKYLFYLFYPVHLLVLYLICVRMGTAGIPVVW